jgi:hypothetical protein
VIARRYASTAPWASLVGRIFGVAFIGCEFAQPSLDLFLVGGK